jgi:hypothetical protein
MLWSKPIARPKPFCRGGGSQTGRSFNRNLRLCPPRLMKFGSSSFKIGNITETLQEKFKMNYFCNETAMFYV